MSVEKVHLDVRYNPDIIRGLIDDLTTQVDVKCALVKKDVDFMSTLIKQSFHLELIKLPKNVKQMSLKQFKKKFGNIEGGVTSTKNGGLYNISENDNNNNNNTIKEMDDAQNNSSSSNKNNYDENDSLFSVPRILKMGSGNTLDLNMLESSDFLDSLDNDDKADALSQMQKMMHGMQAMMLKLENLMVNPETQLTSP